ncbi:outer membrane beta-barrel protein [Polynucleobacter necessarius]|uniref:outer membrane beta-barrel protein n=1 Tax=Polynucleobacter necessarius TaxID=576610 RepID=UPI000E09BAF5|nr:outer membrane beta-barrel protein [Polynucleobacter necessarius]
MKTVKISALVLAMAGVFATSANAQSAKTNAWEGAYGQVSVGYGSFTPNIGGGSASNIPLLRGGPTGSVSSSADNVNTGTDNIGVGYNFGINSDFVLGISAAYYPGASSSAPGAFTTYPVNGGGASSIAAVQYNVKNLYSVTLNPGYVIDKDRLVYAKVGYTGTTIGLNGPTLAYSTVNLGGYTLGLGYKQMVAQSIYLLGEFNYASYSTKNPVLTNTSGVNLTAPISGTGIDFLVGVGYRF